MPAGPIRLSQNYELGVTLAFFCLMALTLSTSSSACWRSALRASAEVSMSAFWRRRLEEELHCVAHGHVDEFHTDPELVIAVIGERRRR